VRAAAASSAAPAETAAGAEACEVVSCVVLLLLARVLEACGWGSSAGAERLRLRVRVPPLLLVLKVLLVLEMAAHRRVVCAWLLS